MVTKLQSAMENLILVFHAYSGKEGDKYKLSKPELKNLLRGELAEILTVSPSAFPWSRLREFLSIHVEPLELLL